ncbi:MAG TPA: site-specific integrase, partial [Pirellulales bacterium]|nr:site-specific integrase [Pirellulales bacterium]
MGGPRRKLLKPVAVAAGAVTGRWVESFVEYLRSECHLAANTVAAYERDMRRFYLWLAGRRVPQLTIQELADYLSWLHQRKLAPASIARHLASLRIFFRYLQLEGLLHDNLAELLGSQKLWERVPHVLSPAMVEKLLDSPPPGQPLWRRDRALLELLYATGCRASEISNLKVEDVHLDECYCLCRGKGD